MKIRSIKPTNKFAEIKFREIIDDPTNKRVLTPTGFQLVLRCGFIKRGHTVTIVTAAGKLVCDPKHVVLTDCGEKFAVDLDCKSDKLIGYGNRRLDFTVEKGPMADLYDVEIEAPHLYYTSGLVSHNSIWLCNNSINSVLNGLDVLHITFEMSAFKTARRCLGALTEVNLKDFHLHKEMIRDRMMRTYSTNKANLAIYDMNPDQSSIDDVANLITMIQRTRGWTPKVLVLDYLELMISKNEHYNRDEYIRQKHVATEVCGLTKSHQTVTYSATQTNRSGTSTANSNDVTDLNKAAESYGKTMPPDYVISLNQSKDEYQATPPQIRMYIAKSREGEKYITINCDVNYHNMKVREGVI